MRSDRCRFTCNPGRNGEATFQETDFAEAIFHMAFTDADSCQRMALTERHREEGATAPA